MMKNSSLVLLGLLVAVCCAAAGLLGGYNKVPLDRDDVIRAGIEASRALSSKFSGKFHHVLHKVTEAKAQVVAGMNYKMTIIVGQTICTKEQAYDDVQECEFQDKGNAYKKCIVDVYRDLKDHHQLVRSGCVLASRNEI